VQFASPGDGLPYIGMGEPGRPVSLWLWRAGRAPELLQATGFGTLMPAAGAAPEAKAVRVVDGWVVVLRGQAPDGANPLPLAVAVWDGRAAARAGQKRLTAWHLLAQPQAKVDPNWLKSLQEEARTAGDAARGQTLMREHGCLGCHAVTGGEPIESGPNLTFAGGLHWPGYLRRAIQEPTAFVVPHPAYQQPDGESLMPRFDLSEEDLSDLVAYLMTLR
jgi:cytochrome c553